MALEGLFCEESFMSVYQTGRNGLQFVKTAAEGWPYSGIQSVGLARCWRASQSGSCDVSLAPACVLQAPPSHVAFRLPLSLWVSPSPRYSGPFSKPTALCQGQASCLQF